MKMIDFYNFLSDNHISYQEFMNVYEKEMFCLECYGKDGLEIDETIEIPPNTKVIEFSRCGDMFTVVLDI